METNQRFKRVSQKRFNDYELASKYAWEHFVSKNGGQPPAFTIGSMSTDTLKVRVKARKGELKGNFDVVVYEAIPDKK